MLYGTALIGGAFSRGVVFSLTPPAAGSTTWTEKVLYSFLMHSKQGVYPDGPLTLSRGETTLTGTTSELEGGGRRVHNGMIYRLRRHGNSWSYAVLYQFPCCDQQPDGSRPTGSLVIDHNGNLFGTTQSGGPNGNFGTVFELSPPTPGQTTCTASRYCIASVVPTAHFRGAVWLRGAYPLPCSAQRPPAAKAVRPTGQGDVAERSSALTRRRPARGRGPLRASTHSQPAPTV